LGALLVMTMIGAACGGDDTSASGTNDGTAAPTTTVAAQPQRGGTIAVAVFTQVRGVDPDLINGSGNTGGTELGAIYDRLVEWNPKTRTYDPRVAESVTPNADATEWTVKLRPGIKFHNGDPLTSDAVKFSIERQKAEGNVRGSLAAVKSVDIIDPLTTKIVLSASWPAFEAFLSGSVGMLVNPTVVKALGKDFASAPVGAGVGPYMFDSFKPGEALVLKKNPNYWDGEPYLDGLRFVPVSGAAQALDFLKGGVVQMAMMRDAKVEAAAKSEGYDGYEVVGSLGEILLVNNGQDLTCNKGEPAKYCAGKPDGSSIRTVPPGADVKVRQAIQLAIDPKVVDQRANDGKGNPALGVFDPSFPWDPGVKVPAQNVEKAKSLVQEAKAAGWNGKIGLSCDNTPQRSATALALQAMLNGVGMDVDMSRAAQDLNSTINDVLVKRDFDLACWGQVTTSDEAGLVGIDGFLRGKSANNYSGYQSAAMDAALNELKVAKTDTDKKAAFKKVADLWVSDAISVPLAAPVERMTWAKNVNGVRGTILSAVVLDKVWLAR
jgi:peptide/nickel transport system substrate-binding protein